MVTKGVKGLPGAAENKEPPANAGNVRGERSSLGREDPGGGNDNHSSILASGQRRLAGHGPRGRRVAPDWSGSAHVGVMGGRDKSGVWDHHGHITVYKTDHQQGPTAVHHREPCSMFHNKL